MLLNTIKEIEYQIELNSIEYQFGIKTYDELFNSNMKLFEKLNNIIENENI